MESNSGTVAVVVTGWQHAHTHSVHR